MTLDVTNHGIENAIAKNALAISSTKTPIELLEDPTNLLCLNHVLKQQLVKVNIRDHLDLWGKLCNNLSTNSRQLRISTIKLMLKMFETADFIIYDQEEHGHLLDLDSANKHYKGECLMLDFLWKIEEPEITFETEKTKGSNLRNVSVLIKTGLLPEPYMQAAYHYLVGCMWIKFVPLLAHVFECLQEVFALNVYI